MHTIDTANAVGSQFVNRDEINRKPGTIIDASIMNAMQNEIVNVILGADIQLDKTKHDQLKTAIAKYISDLGASLSIEIGKLQSKDSLFDGKFEQIFRSLSELDNSSTTNYGSSTLIKTYTFTEPNANNYYFAPHTQGFALVTLNGVLLKKTVDWDDANNGEGIELSFSWENLEQDVNTLEIICFVSGEMIKITTQVPVGSTTTWYGSEDTIPQSYIALKGQLLNEYDEYAKLVELFPVSLPDTRTANSVVIIKAYDYVDLGEDFSNRYYGPHNEDPLINLSGGIPVPGDCYYNVPLRKLKYYDGDKWIIYEIEMNYIVLTDPTTLTHVNKNYMLASNSIFFLPNTWDLEIGDSVTFVSKYDISGASVKVYNATTDIIKLSSLISDNQVDFSSGFKLTFIYLGSGQWQVTL